MYWTIQDTFGDKVKVCLWCDVGGRGGPMIVVHVRRTPALEAASSRGKQAHTVSDIAGLVG